MRKKTALFALVLFLTAAPSVGSIRLAHAAGWTVSLDANVGNSGTIRTDVSVDSSASQTHSFRIGAVLTGASRTNPLTFSGFQLTFVYNVTEFVPEGDPNSTASAYPDGACYGLLYGSALVPGPSVDCDNPTPLPGDNPGQLTILFTVAPSSITLNAPAQLLSVQFEIIGRASPSTQTFSMTNVIFVDSNGFSIAGV